MSLFSFLFFFFFWSASRLCYYLYIHLKCFWAPCCRPYSFQFETSQIFTANIYSVALTHTSIQFLVHGYHRPSKFFTKCYRKFSHNIYIQFLNSLDDTQKDHMISRSFCPQTLGFRESQGQNLKNSMRASFWGTTSQEWSMCRRTRKPKNNFQKLQQF